MCHNLLESLDLRQGNHSVYEYTQEFNNLEQYGGHHIDTAEKKVELFCMGLMIQVQDHLILSPILSCNELTRAAIDQEGTMKACEATNDKKRKRAMPGPSGGSSSGAPPEYRMIYTSPSGQPCHPPLFWAAICRSNLSSSSNSTVVLFPHHSSR
jgi:hypothetical protein